MAACRSRSAAVARASPHPALGQRHQLQQASVTPLQADSTTASRASGCDSTMAATRSKHSASATLEPPNLCTTQELGARELMAWALFNG